MVIYTFALALIMVCDFNDLFFIFDFMGNSREIITHFCVIYDINKVGYLHRQPTSNVLSNPITMKSNIFETN